MKAQISSCDSIRKIIVHTNFRLFLVHIYIIEKHLSKQTEIFNTNKQYNLIKSTQIYPHDHHRNFQTSHQPPLPKSKLHHDPSFSNRNPVKRNGQTHDHTTTQKAILATFLDLFSEKPTNRVADGNRGTLTRWHVTGEIADLEAAEDRKGCRRLW